MCPVSLTSPWTIMNCIKTERETHNSIAGKKDLLYVRCAPRIFIDWVITQTVVVSFTFFDSIWTINRYAEKPLSCIKLFVLAVMNELLRHMGGYAAWLSKITCCFLELQVLARKFLLMPQNTATFYSWYKILGWIWYIINMDENPSFFEMPQFSTFDLKGVKSYQSQNYWKWKIAI